MNQHNERDNKFPDGKKTLNPWFYIPTLYFTEGIPFIIVNQLSVALLKSLDVSNVVIGYTNLLYLPWAIKFLWGPIVDGRGTKRGWLLAMQLALAVLFGFTAVVLGITYSLIPFIALLFITAFVSATHDIAIDGYYLYALNKKDQALFTGIRSAFYRVAMIFSGGVLVFLAGEVGTKYNDIRFGWEVAFIVAAVIFLVFRIYHSAVLPKVEMSRKSKKILSLPFKETFLDYFRQEKIGVILAFILLYRFGEGLLVRMAQPFLMDKVEAGGLNISVSDIGVIYGTFGIIALVIGGILGGWLIKKYGLRKLFFPLAIMMNACNLLYAILATVNIGDIIPVNILGFSFNFYPLVQSFVMIEQFGYGLGFTAFMVFLLYTSKGEYKTSHFAISTGFMAFGMIIPGTLSGILQEAVGYYLLFIISTIVAVPGMLLIKFLPIPTNNED
jgi:PAT family beta-lactamase induction signal transducer AmpG